MIRTKPARRRAQREALELEYLDLFPEKFAREPLEIKPKNPFAAFRAIRGHDEFQILKEASSPGFRASA